MLVCLGCNRKEPAKQSEVPPPGTIEETWRFWESLNKAATTGTGIEALDSPAWQGNVDTADICAVLEDIIAGERARSRAITTLPVLHVDPDLAEYALEFARSRTDLANVLQDYVTLAKKQQEMTSMPVLGVGLLLNLLNHSDDKEDGILWRALLDEGRQTANNVQSLQEPAKAFEAKAASVRGEIGQINTDEMSVRIKLAQKFDREFPPRDTYISAAAIAKPNDRPLSKRQIIRTLIGQKIGGVFDGWTFDSPQEFVSFNIVSVTNRSNVRTDYEVQAHLKGIPSGQERDVDLHLTYGWLYTHWKLVGIQQLQ
jgi:hypothetical protein